MSQRHEVRTCYWDSISLVTSLFVSKSPFAGTTFCPRNLLHEIQMVWICAIIEREQFDPNSEHRIVCTDVANCPYLLPETLSSPSLKVLFQITLYVIKFPLQTAVVFNVPCLPQNEFVMRALSYHIISCSVLFSVVYSALGTFVQQWYQKKPLHQLLNHFISCSIFNALTQLIKLCY